MKLNEAQIVGRGPRHHASADGKRCRNSRTRPSRRITGKVAAPFRAHLCLVTGGTTNKRPFNFEALRCRMSDYRS